MERKYAPVLVSRLRDFSCHKNFYKDYENFPINPEKTKPQDRDISRRFHPFGEITERNPNSKGNNNLPSLTSWPDNKPRKVQPNSIGNDGILANPHRFHKDSRGKWRVRQQLYIPKFGTLYHFTKVSSNDFKVMA